MTWQQALTLHQKVPTQAVKWAFQFSKELNISLCLWRVDGWSERDPAKRRVQGHVFGFGAGLGRAEMSTGRRNDRSSLSLPKSTRYFLSSASVFSLSTGFRIWSLCETDCSLRVWAQRWEDCERRLVGWSDDLSSGNKQDGNRCRNEFDRGIWREPIPLFYAALEKKLLITRLLHCFSVWNLAEGGRRFLFEDGRRSHVEERCASGRSCRSNGGSVECSALQRLHRLAFFVFVCCSSDLLFLLMPADGNPAAGKLI